MDKHSKVASALKPFSPSHDRSPRPQPRLPALDQDAAIRRQPSLNEVAKKIKRNASLPDTLVFDPQHPTAPICIVVRTLSPDHSVHTRLLSLGDAFRHPPSLHVRPADLPPVLHQVKYAEVRRLIHAGESRVSYPGLAPHEVLAIADYWLKLPLAERARHNAAVRELTGSDRNRYFRTLAAKEVRQAAAFAKTIDTYQGKTRQLGDAICKTAIGLPVRECFHGWCIAINDRTRASYAAVAAYLWAEVADEAERRFCIEQLRRLTLVSLNDILKAKERGNPYIGPTRQTEATQRTRQFMLDLPDVLDVTGKDAGTIINRYAVLSGSLAVSEYVALEEHAQAHRSNTAKTPIRKGRAKVP